MNHKRTICAGSALAMLMFSAAVIFAGNIDPNGSGSRYAYGENIGWLNFEPNQGPGVTVADNKLSGFVWAENIGWINLSPVSYGGVTNDGTGLLGGYGWGENVGWINFAPAHGGVTIDGGGKFNGWAWGENIGWIHFNSATPVAYNVRTSWLTSCTVGFDDLDRFCDLWLATGSGLKADLNGSNDVDFVDYGIFAGYWHGPCPAGWPLKN